jgi:hypothetical protein
MILADEQYENGLAGPLADGSAASASNGVTLWPLTDHLGSVRDLVSSVQNQREHVIYDSFGNRIFELRDLIIA